MLNNNSISLDEFVEYAQNNINFDNEESIRSIEPYLRKLNNNKALLPEAICKELSISFDNFQPENTYQALGYILHKCEDFIVRAVCWLPENKRKFNDSTIDRGLQLFSAPHDHDFSFMTIGHYGSGYYSDIYEYDQSLVLGEPGEAVKLVKCDFKQLEKDKTFYYRAGKDVHIQIPPDEMSISINFIIRKRAEQHYLDQFLFDIENEKIVRPFENDTFRRAKSIELIAALSEGSAFKPLFKVKDSHDCRRTRIKIMQTLELLKPEMKQEIWQQALNDKDPVVKKAAIDAISR